MHVQSAMHSQLKDLARTGTKPSTAAAVDAPKANQGIINALRRAYAPQPNSAPNDLWALLDRLD